MAGTNVGVTHSSVRELPPAFLSLGGPLNPYNHVLVVDSIHLSVAIAHCLQVQ